MPGRAARPDLSSCTRKVSPKSAAVPSSERPTPSILARREAAPRPRSAGQDPHNCPPVVAGERSQPLKCWKVGLILDRRCGGPGSKPVVETYGLLPILATAMSSATRSDPLRDLRSSLADLMTRDRERLRRRLDGSEKIRDPAKRAATHARIGADIATAAARVAARTASVPRITYPDELP